MNIEEAIADVNVIKNIIKKTRSDVSDIAFFFIWIGILNISIEVLKIIGLKVLSKMESVTLILWKILRFLDIVPILGITLLFLIYYMILRTKGNDISVSILKIWGILLIGGTIFSKLFLIILTQKANAELIIPFTKSYEFLLYAIGFVVLGIIIHEKIILIIASVCSLLYLLLMKLDVNILLATFNSEKALVKLYDMYSIVIISIGMILVGIHLHIKRKKNGDRFNTYYISK